MARGFTASVGRRSLRGQFSVGADATHTRDARASMKSIIGAYKRLVRGMEDITPSVLLLALEPTFEKSQEYCPKDTGALVESGYLQITQFRGKPRVEIGYGLGGVPPYAAAVHENLEWKHKAPTRAKWLQVALEEDANEIENRIAAAYKGMF